MSGVGPLEPDRLADLLAALIPIVEAELRALGPALCCWRPAPGGWCANEIVGHLVEAERRGFAGRIRVILAADEPELEGWDQPAVAAARHDCDRRPEELLGELAALRLESVALVRSLTPDDLARAGRHPVAGRLTVGEILGEWVHPRSKPCRSAPRARPGSRPGPDGGRAPLRRSRRLTSGRPCSSAPARRCSSASRSR